MHIENRLWFLFALVVLRIHGFQLQPSQPSFSIANKKWTTSSLFMATIEIPSTKGEPFSFGDRVWEAYESTVPQVLESKRVLKKDKLENLQAAKNVLLSRNFLSSIPSPLDTNDEEAFKNNLISQKERYMEHYQLSKADYDYIMRCLVYMGDHCARRQTFLGICVAWQKLKEAGIMPRENAISTYMYILGQDETCSDTLMEVATFHDMLFEPNEKTTTLRIKTLIAKKQVKEAEQILSSLSDKRLRTFLPILDHYCNIGDSGSILRVFRQMRQSSGVHFDVDSYALILTSLVQQFRSDATPIQHAENVGFQASYGPSLLDELVSEMAEDILELTEPTARKIYQSFREGFSDICGEHAEDNDEIPALSSKEEFSPSDLIIGRVEVDDIAALCPATGAKLRLIALDQDQRQHVHDTLIKMAGIQYIEYTKNRKSPIQENLGLEELTRFSEWLNSREGDPFTVVVDGPNVGFYGFGEFHYSNVKVVVEALERMGETPLVTMPEKYVLPSFKLRYGERQHLSKEDLEVIEFMQEEGKMYVVPQLCLDDYYWMLASVSNQTSTRQSADLQVETGDVEGRFPGLRPMLVTNDQMRDHKLELLEPREFRRWCSCHIVNYEVPKPTGHEWEDRPVNLSPADFFSREIQGNAWNGEQGTVWHFPVTGWDEPSRFCLFIPP